ncbi:hypothetical protein ES705_25699 [subsurface metagenome]
MDYGEAKKRLTKWGCEFLTKDELLARIRQLKMDEVIFHPYGCLGCGQANGEDDFTNILYAVYPTKPGTDSLSGGYEGELGITLGGKLTYTTIARCKFCGACDIYSDV